eukprot:176272-Pyramimonas_sp.AAC.1
MNSIRKQTHIGAAAKPKGTSCVCEDSRVSRRCGARLKLTVRKRERATSTHKKRYHVDNGEAKRGPVSSNSLTQQGSWTALKPSVDWWGCAKR